MSFCTLKKPKDFQRVKKSPYKFFSNSFIIQWAPKSHGDGEDSRQVGLIATKRLGKAVKRNRAKRRLREIIRIYFLPFCPDYVDYILVARQGVISNTFEELIKEIKFALKIIDKECKPT